MGIDAYIANIQEWLDNATEEDVETGLAWYDEAYNFCHAKAKEYNIDPVAVATVVAILSPQKKWEQNLEEASAMLEETFNGVKPSKGYFASGKALQECRDALLNGFRIPALRLKTSSFVDNIVDKTSMMVTIDRHAIKVANNDLTAAEISITAKRYREASAAYVVVAAMKGIKPYQVQAITWVAYKRVVGR